MRKYLRKISYYSAQKLFKNNEEIVISNLNLECIYIESAKAKVKYSNIDFVLFFKPSTGDSWNKFLLNKKLEKEGLRADNVNFYKIETSTTR